MLCMAVAVMGGLASCEEHTDEYDGSLKVGNILLADNSIVSPQGYDSKNQTAVGVIFYASRDTALVVSRYELGSYAYADSLGTVGSVNSDSRTLCGTENTAALLVSEIPTPAAEAVADFRSPMASWALPSAGELSQLHTRRQHIRKRADVLPQRSHAKRFCHIDHQDNTWQSAPGVKTQIIYTFHKV